MAYNGAPTLTASAWCTVSVKTDLMIYLYHHWKFGIHLKRCIFTMFVHAFFVYAYYLSICKYRFRIVSNVYVFIATQFVTVFSVKVFSKRTSLLLHVTHLMQRYPNFCTRVPDNQLSTIDSSPGWTTHRK